MARKEQLEYVPKSLDETDDQWNQDPVSLGMTDRADPANASNPERHLEDGNRQPDPLRHAGK
jgi:hypothetical protein